MIPDAVRFLLQDIRTYGLEAVELVGERDAAEILKERMREHSVIRTVQIVGEAAAQILRVQPQGFEGIQLRETVSLRNMLVHGYGKIRMDLVVGIVKRDLPGLISDIETMLGETS